jgi:hypothetical protein
MVSGYSGAHGFLRVAARSSEMTGGKEVAHHGDAARPDLEHVAVRRCDRREDRRVVAVGLVLGVGLTGGVERLLGVQDRPARPCVRGHDQVPQRLSERPLAADRNTGRASRHRRDPLEGGRPRPLQHSPGSAQPSGSVARRSARPGKRRLSSASTSGITSTPLTRKKLSPSKSHGASMSVPRTSTARITTPDRSALRNRAPRRFASTNSAACRSSERVKVAMTSPSRAPRHRWRT